MRRRPSARATLAIAALGVALAASGLLAQWHLAGRASALDRIEAPLLDLRFLIAGPRPAPAGIVIVAIDDETVREAGRHPLPRSRIAGLVRELARHGARAVALDILFLDPGPPDDDQALVQALNATNGVVAAASQFARGEGAEAAAEGSRLPDIARVLWPVDGVRQAARVGLVNISTDAGGTPRHVPLLLRGEGTWLASFPLQAAALASGAVPSLSGDRLTIGDAVSRLDADLTLPLRFYGPRGSITTVSAGAVLAGKAGGETISDKLVVVGTTAVGTADTFATPFDPVLPGVEVLATATGHLMAGDGLVRDGLVRRIDAAAAVAFALAAVLLLLALPLSLGLVLTGAAAASWLVFTAVALRAGFWFSAVVPLAAMVPPVILCTLGRQVLDRRHTRRLASAEAALRLFQPPALARRITRDPTFLAEPVEQLASVVFIDLSRFTRLSERLGPAGTRDLLKEFHALVEDVVEPLGGLVLGFMGDGAMVVFGLPEARPEDARNALRAATALATRVRDWLSLRAGGDAPEIDVRVGAHSGPVVVSRLGSDTHQHITATGDSVNVASRLLDIAAQESATVVVSGDLLRAAGEDAPERRAFSGLNAVAIRGRREPIEVAVRHSEAKAVRSGAASR